MHNPSPAQTDIYVAGENGIAGVTIGAPTTIRAHWEVQYAKFFTFLPFLSPSTVSSSLRPLYPGKKRRVKGTWLRCSPSSIASLCILSLLMTPSSTPPSSCLSAEPSMWSQEEHYVSQLNFTWPQVSCDSDCRIRGSRVILAGYGDSMGQIQKCAMQFPSSAEAQTFMETLKFLQAEEVKVDCFNGMPSRLLHHRIIEESNYANPSVEGTSIRQEYLHHTCSQQAMLNYSAEAIDLGLPPSFTSLLSDCCTETEPGIFKWKFLISKLNYRQGDIP